MGRRLVEHVVRNGVTGLADVSCVYRSFNNSGAGPELHQIIISLLKHKHVPSHRHAARAQTRASSEPGQHSIEFFALTLMPVTETVIPSLVMMMMTMMIPT